MYPEVDFLYLDEQEMIKAGVKKMMAGFAKLKKV